jgi:hypothetical protein
MHIDYFKNPIPAPKDFKEGNAENISHTIKVDISIKRVVTECILLGAVCSSEEALAYKTLF